MNCYGRSIVAVAAVLSLDIAGAQGRRGMGEITLPVPEHGVVLLKLSAL